MVNLYILKSCVVFKEVINSAKFQDISEYMGQEWRRTSHALTIELLIHSSTLSIPLWPNLFKRDLEKNRLQYTDLMMHHSTVHKS